MSDYQDNPYDDAKPKRGLNPQTAPCPICHATDYEWGKPGSEGGLYFVPEGTWFGFGQGEPLRLRKCLSCGNVQIFLR
jgi:hypothetical protein